jgi:uroporphyrinogen-III synthase
MRVLLTRPIAESERLAALLRARGHEAVLSPVMEIRFRDGPQLALEGVQAILATSANGARALAQRTSSREIPLYAVGPQTSEAARKAEFTNIHEAGGDSAALVEAVQALVPPQDGTLLLATGRERTGDVERDLAVAGFTVRVEELYDAREIPQPSAEAASALAEGCVDAVMLFSPRSAQIFVRQVQSAKLEPKCDRMTALCISEGTSAALQPLSLPARRVARRPDQESMLQLLDDTAPTPSAQGHS